MSIDAWLLDRVYQRVADWVADRGWLSCYGLAYWWGTILGAVNVVEAFARYQLGVDGPGGAFLVISLLVGTAWSAILRWRAERAERNWLSRSAIGCDARVSDVTGRRWWLALLILPLACLTVDDWKWTVVHLMALVWNICTLNAAYFLACNPRVPKQKRARLPSVAYGTA